MHDVIVVGGGIFGISTAIELAERNYRVGLLNPDTIPHHLAASTDISKIVRMEYGSDSMYCEMGEECINRWHQWNDVLGEQVYHEVGLLMLCKNDLDHPSQKFEHDSHLYIKDKGYPYQLLDAQQISSLYPSINTNLYNTAHFNPRAGYVESAHAIERLATYARLLGVEIYQHRTVQSLEIYDRQVEAVLTKEGQTFPCGQVVIAAGAYTPQLIPELSSQMKATGHPVFWLKPNSPQDFMAERLPVFTADISNTGWYGFPFHTKNGVVKIAKHTNGLILDPEKDDRHITAAEISDMRSFVADSFPSLADAALVYTRRCLYNDTLDGHFWIDNHPEIKGLTVSSGGSGHGMKMGPILGEITVDVLEGIPNSYANRFVWRELSTETLQEEEARYIDSNRQ